MHVDEAGGDDHAPCVNRLVRRKAGVEHLRDPVVLEEDVAWTGAGPGTVDDLRSREKHASFHRGAVYLRSALRTSNKAQNREAPRSGSGPGGSRDQARDVVLAL